MNFEALEKLIAETEEVARHKEYILALARPSVDIELVTAPAQDAGSRFGGHPLLPKGFRWPAHPIGQYRFLGQVNFGEIVHLPAILPRSGLLSLFYAYDEDGEVFWQDDGYILGFYWENYAQHTLLESPGQPAPIAHKIALTGSRDIPRHSELRDDWPFEPDYLFELIDEIQPTTEYLLGYPSFNTLGYDPTPGPEWISLLTVTSLDELDWCWHDGDRLMVFIEAEKLRRRDFSGLKSDAG